MIWSRAAEFGPPPAAGDQEKALDFFRHVAFCDGCDAHMEQAPMYWTTCEAGGTLWAAWEESLPEDPEQSMRRGL